MWCSLSIELSFGNKKFQDASSHGFLSQKSSQRVQNSRSMSEEMQSTLFEVERKGVLLESSLSRSQGIFAGTTVIFSALGVSY